MRKRPGLLQNYKVKCLDQYFIVYNLLMPHVTIATSLIVATDISTIDRSFCDQHSIHFSHDTAMCHLCPNKRPRALSCQGMPNRPASSPRACFLKTRRHYANFVPQAKNAANEATVYVCVGCCGAWSASERSQLSELIGPTFDSLHKNLAWWAVTRETLKTVKNGGGLLPRTIRYKITISPCLTG